MISRRKFALNSLAALTGSIMVPAAKAEITAPQKWDETVDVIVVGSGFAGLAAAIEAAQAGAKTIVLEKMQAFGGNSIINGGIYPLPGSDLQKKEGIEDSEELLIKDMLAAGENLNHIEKVKATTSQAQSTFKWCSDLGVEWNWERVGVEGGHSVPREMTTKSGFGSGIVIPEFNKCKELGVPVRTRTYVEEIIREPGGAVLGLKIREGYRFPNAESGKVKFIKANKGVVLCHGGFGADVKYRSMEDPRLSAQVGTTNQKGATAELWREASRIGCHLIQVDRIQCLPYSNPKENGLEIAFIFHAGCAAPYGAWVSNLTGKRFVNEEANRKVRADAIFAELEKGGHCYSICNESNTAAQNIKRPGMLQKCVDRGVVEKFETIEELAKAKGIPLEGLKQTIQAVNESLKTGVDKEFGRHVMKGAQPLDKGPWYCSELMPKVHHAMGGILTDAQARCLDVVTDKPIPGLYAAGEATGGVHGAVRLGSCAVLDCLVNGRIAGKSAASAS